MKTIMSKLSILVVAMTLVIGGLLNTMSASSELLFSHEIGVTQKASGIFTIQTNHPIEVASTYGYADFILGVHEFELNEVVNKTYITSVGNSVLRLIAGTTDGDYVLSEAGNHYLYQYKPMDSATYWQLGTTLPNANSGFTGEYDVTTTIPDFIDASLMTAGDFRFLVKSSGTLLTENGAVVAQQDYGNVYFKYGITSLNVNYTGLPAGENLGMQYGDTIVNTLYAPTSYKGFDVSAGITALGNTTVASPEAVTTTFTNIRTFNIGDTYVASDGNTYQCVSVTLPSTGTYSKDSGSFEVTEASGSHQIIYAFESLSRTLSYAGVNLVPSSQIFDLNDTVTVDYNNGAPTETITMDDNKSIPNPTREGYVFNGFLYSVDTNTLTASWLEDRLTGEADENGGAIGDGIPDIYQTVITYHVVNGTWDGTNSEPQTRVVTFYVDGKPSNDLAAVATILKPNEMQANTGYENGTWDKDISQTTYERKDDNSTFTHTFTLQNHEVTYPTSTGNQTVTLPHGTTVIVDNADDSPTQTVTVDEVKTLDTPTREGYIFNGYEYDAVTKTFTASWLEDRLTGEVDENGELIGDGIPDIYQTVITYHVVNGTWDGTNSEPQTRVVTFYVDGKPSNDLAAVAAITKPTGMQPNTGYDANTGNWADGDTVTIAFGDANTTFEYGYDAMLKVSYLGVNSTNALDLDITNQLFNAGTVVNVNNMNGDIPYTITVSVDTMLSVPTRTGYTFTGYTYDIETNTFNATWKEVTYTVQFNSNGGSNIPSQEVASGGFISEPTKPSKEGFIFTGWYLDEQLTQLFDFNTMTMPSNGITLYAGYIVDEALSPSTGDTTNITLWFAGSVISLAAMIYVYRKNRSN